MLGRFWFSGNRLESYTLDECVAGASLSIRPGGYCVFDQRLPTNGRHFHHCYELCIATGGSGEFIHGDVVYQVRAGDIFIADPGVPHEIRLQQETPLGELRLVFFVINITPGASMAHEQLATMLTKFLDGHTIHKPNQLHILEYLTFLDKYQEQRHGTRFGILSTLRNTAIECLLALLPDEEASASTKSAQQSTLDRALRYINGNIHRRIYMEELANVACTSVRNLQLLFKHHLGVSAITFINERKLAVAAAYLRMNFKIDDITPLIGINDLSQFSRLFKQHYGISPKKYQLRFHTNGMVYGAGWHVEGE